MFARIVNYEQDLRALRIAALLSVVFLPIITGDAKLNPTCDAQNREAMRLMDEMRDGDAVALLSKVIEHDGGRAEDKFCAGVLRFNLGLAKFELGEQSGAEAAVKDALALMEQAVGNSSPELRRPLYFLANLALGRDQFRKVGELINRLESLPWETHVDLAEWHSLRATLLARQQHNAEAEQEYVAAVSERELAGTRSSVGFVFDLWNLAALNLNKQRGAAALLLLKRGLEISEAEPLYPDLRVRILTGLGVAYNLLGDREPAERSFQRAMQLVDSVSLVSRPVLGSMLYHAYSRFLEDVGRKKESKQLKIQGEALYGRDTSRMTVSLDSLLPKPKGR